ncbi:MAG: hypothetical protein IKW96_00020 [Ruminococcus sp.]|uniref:hypothetical protein n=1 Tax=Ruminococcus sp. TaxID=41978 RepID=UPI0025E155AB|nr:hypothetical protein [Ruminococcus sp.]MBR5681655.1 hypothetical protein [Ruminococcus sp.]
MSNLKLYKGINNIDDNLIEEADCKRKPVIHHCYGVAASAAAIFIAVGALGIFHTANPDKKPVLSGNDAVIEQSTVEITTTLPLISDEIIQTSSVQTSSQASQCTETTTQLSLSYSKTSAIQKNSHIQTTAMPAITVTQTSSAGDETGTATASNITTTVPEYDYEYEGSLSGYRCRR